MLTDSPAWNHYKAILTRVAKAGARLTAAHDHNEAEKMAAE